MNKEALLKKYNKLKYEKYENDLIKDYEKKFDEYKDEIISKFSDFVDSIFEEELTIPDKVLEYAAKGELYDDLIKQFKVRLSIDGGLLDKEVKALLKEAAIEIRKLRTDTNKLIDENLEYKNYAGIMAMQLYVNFELLKVKSEKARKKIKQLLLTSDDDVKYFDKEDIDRIIMEISNG
jgi:hypothetical protein